MYPHPRNYCAIRVDYSSFEHEAKFIDTEYRFKVEDAGFGFIKIPDLSVNSSNQSGKMKLDACFFSRHVNTNTNNG